MGRGSIITFSEEEEEKKKEEKKTPKIEDQWTLSVGLSLQGLVVQ